MTDSFKDNCPIAPTTAENAEPIQDESPTPLQPSPGIIIDKVDWYRELLKLDPTSHVSFLAAEELCGRGLWEEAKEVCRAGLTFHPYHLRGQILLGQALWESGNTEEAEVVLLKVRDDLEKHVEAFNCLAESAQNRGNLILADKFRFSYQAAQPLQAEASIAPESFYRAFEQASLPNLESEVHEVQEAPEESQTPEPATAPEIVEVIMAEPEPSVMAPPEPLFMPLLSALMEKYEQSPGGTVSEPQILFSDSDRQALKSLLTHRLH